MKNKLCIVSIFLLFIVAALAGEIMLSEPEWNFGTLTSQEDLQSRELIVANSGSRTVTVRIVPTCNCLTVSPGEAVIAAGESAFFRLFYDPFEDVGPVERSYQIFTDQKDSISQRFKVFGYLDVPGAVPLPAVDLLPEKTIGNDPPPADYDLALLYYYEQTCPKCRDFIQNKFPALEQKLGAVLYLSKHNTEEANNISELLARLKVRGLAATEYPVIFVGDVVLQGNPEIDSRLENVLRQALAEGWVTDLGATDSGIVDLSEEITLVASFLAGLLDGINPCAFATIIMLLSSLALAGKRRREILIMGIFFTVSVYATYFAIGVGIFKLVQAATSFALIGEIIRWVLVAVLAVFTVLSLVDYFKIRAGNPEKMTLQLPDMLKKRIKNSIRTYVRSTALVLSSLILGFLVSLFELGCTGQIYFPIIRSMVRAGGDNSFLGYFFLFIYCLGFIIPLAGVFIVTYRGIGSRKVTQFFQEKMGLIKLIMAGLFAAMILLTIYIN